MRLAVVLLLVLLLLLSGPRLAAAGRSAKGPVSAYAVDGAAVELAGAPGSGGSSFPADPLLPCMAELLPCTAYLRSGRNPSRTCCTAMHDGAVDEMQCLCRLLADPELLHTFNVTRDQMFRLPARCGLPVGCRAGAAGSPEPGSGGCAAAAGRHGPAATRRSVERRPEQKQHRRCGFGRSNLRRRAVPLLLIIPQCMQAGHFQLL
ncbi:non-specific lipid transfer protein GPI-anchored 24-like isoform X1 [Oryza brachyantha]|uniref:non-specific lipid transfer protein GPI-anchored 24-like isoform X1 n=1 Tax=Oryza brachyantha TaxID=4533 RepID=UPI001ADC400E|nr:non-specific lipid transfer protein GPI-anchored 24-like isoform X1 [Oryza brachyantha]